ncbi:hypothetical protein BCR44DRAFT_1213836 [Catenaria anguillulae PL171]|uniref:Uncharacterized protein n=1 Tax=Catenaria anguillulae PL171 TaxID=765915 RepID=A0A1Y2HYJ6_9FUNG|nr:hypothetical protein BCR44DRAFT_1213836 [Catenaria anguillulae PL171]
MLVSLVHAGGSSTANSHTTRGPNRATFASSPITLTSSGNASGPALGTAKRQLVEMMTHSWPSPSVAGASSCTVTDVSAPGSTCPTCTARNIADGCASWAGEPDRNTSSVDQGHAVEPELSRRHVLVMVVPGVTSECGWTGSSTRRVARSCGGQVGVVETGATCAGGGVPALRFPLSTVDLTALFCSLAASGPLLATSADSATACALSSSWAFAVTGSSFLMALVPLAGRAREQQQALLRRAARHVPRTHASCDPRPGP